MVAVGAKIQQLKLFETIANEVHITQKIIKHKPVKIGCVLKFARIKNHKFFTLKVTH